MKESTIKELGVFNVETGLEVAEGKLEMRVHVDENSAQLNEKLDEVYECYKKSNPQIEQKNIFYEVRLVFQFGCANPEFSLMIIVFDKDDKGHDEFWDELEVTLSEEEKKQFRKIAWDKLGEAILAM